MLKNIVLPIICLLLGITLIFVIIDARLYKTSSIDDSQKEYISCRVNQIMTSDDYLCVKPYRK